MQRKLNFVKNPRFRSNKKCLLYENEDFKEVIHRDNPFAVDPPIVMFRDYQIGTVYSTTLNLINQTQLLKNFKYIPPISEYFAVKSISYPKKDSSLIAPGMKAKVEILFKPETLDPYNDHLTIISEFYAFKIPIKAIRENAALTIENPMNCHKCLVGEQSSMVFRCRNNGGDAHFKFELPEAEHVESANNSLDGGYDLDGQNLTLNVGPFSIFPKEFYLIKNMPIEIFVNFHPKAQGMYDKQVNLVCDSRMTFPQKIIGEGIMTEVFVSEYEGLEINYEKNPLDNINFEPTFPLSSSEKVIKIRNKSCVPVNYHWAIYSFYPENKIKLHPKENFFAIFPEKGVLQPDSETPFTISFTPKSGRIYENKIDFIIEDIPFQAIKHLNQNYTREKNLNTSTRDSILNIEKYSDPFLLGFSSPFPFYPLLTFNLAGLGRINELTLDKAIINLGKIYLGKPYQSEFRVMNKLSGIILFKMKKIFQFYKKKSSVHDYFKNFTNNKEAEIKFGPYYEKNLISLKDEIEKEEESKDENMMKHNIMEHILALADNKLVNYESNFEETDELYLTSYNGFYIKKIDFSTIKKARKKKKKNFIPPRARTKNTVIKATASEEKSKSPNNKRLSKVNNKASLAQIGDNIQSAQSQSKGRMSKNFELNSSTRVKTNSFSQAILTTRDSKHSKGEFLSYSSTKLSKLNIDPIKKITENMIYLADYDDKEGVRLVINFTPTKLGDFKATIVFSAQDCQPISIDVFAEVIGPEVEIKTPAVVFPLCPVSTIQKESIIIKNTSEIDAIVLVKEHRYSGVSFDNAQTYEDTNKGILTNVGMRRSINNMRDFMNQNTWKIDFAKTDSYLLMLSNIYFKLAPQEEKEITISFACPYPIRYEDLIQIDVMNGESKFLRVKANCQLADCYLDEILIKPEKIFISTPVIHGNNSFKMINPSNLPITFKWDSIDIPEEKQILFFPESGTIEPNSVQEIKYKIIFHTIKEVDELLVCTFPELDLPLGIEIKGEVKGLDISYEITDETLANSIQNDNISQISGQTGVTSSTGVKFRSKKEKDKTSIDKTVNKFDFTLGVNKFMSQSFVIKNKSGIPTEYRLSLLNYAPPGASTLENDLESTSSKKLVSLTDGLDGKNNTSSVSQKTRFSNRTNKTQKKSKPLLSDKHEQVNFTSEKGMEFSVKKQIEKEAETYLKNKKGISIVVSPLGGILEPYSDTEIKISVYNECVGDFYDELTCEVKGLAEKQIFPIRVKIRGNPIQISPFQPGIDYLSSPNIIKVGSVLLLSGYIEKTFKILNTGNNKININWKLYDYEDIMTPKNRDIVNLKIKETEHGTLDSQISNEKNSVFNFNFEPVEPKEFNMKYFMLNPTSGQLLPKNTADFKVTFATDIVGLKSALLVAQPVFEDEMMSSVKMSDLAVRINAWGIQPHLTVNKPPSLEGNIIYSFTEHSSGANFSNRRAIILMNKEKIELKVKLIIKGSFKITNVQPRETVIMENLFSIMPNTNLKVDVKFLAPPVNDEEQWPMLLQNEKHGKMIALFENGMSEEFFLRGILKRPRLVLSLTGNESVAQERELIDFGYVNVESQANSEFYILNETDVGTNWVLNYVQFKKKNIYGYGTTTEEEKEDIKQTDDPCVFNFHIVEGFINGPSNILTNMPLGPGLNKRDDYNLERYAPIMIKVVFKPKKNVFYKSRFRIATTTGNNIDFILKGWGSYLEEHIKPILLKNDDKESKEKKEAAEKEKKEMEKTVSDFKELKTEKADKTGQSFRKKK